MNDPFDSSFVQNFTAAMEAVEGAGSDIVVACAYVPRSARCSVLTFSAPSVELR